MIRHMTGALAIAVTLVQSLSGCASVQPAPPYPTKAVRVVIPYPAGYLEDGAYIWHPTLDVLGNFYKLQVATKEIVGIIAYSLTGKL